MTQSAVFLTHPATVQVQLPHPQHEVMDGLIWGALEAFPTPAYWHYQVVARRLTGQPAPYRLGRSLAEEVGACLLGGHGIPATVGLAAYEHLRAKGAFAGLHYSQEQIEAWLREPLTVNDRQVNYRFAAQKAKYLAAALLCLPWVFAVETREIHWTGELLGALAWSVLAISLGAVFLLFVLIREGAATQVTSLLYLTPPTTAIMAFVLFDEPITLLTLLGTLSTAFGVWLVMRPSRKRATLKVPTSTGEK